MESLLLKLYLGLQQIKCLVYASQMDALDYTRIWISNILITYFKTSLRFTTFVNIVFNWVISPRHGLAHIRQTKQVTEYWQAWQFTYKPESQYHNGRSELVTLILLLQNAVITDTTTATTQSMWYFILQGLILDTINDIYMYISNTNLSHAGLNNFH